MYSLPLKLYIPPTFLYLTRSYPSLSLSLLLTLLSPRDNYREALTKRLIEEEREMGRAPCCDKASVKKGPWSPEEDAALRDYIERHGIGGNWIALPKKAGMCH